MDSQQNCDQQHQLTTTTSADTDAAGVVCPSAEDPKPTSGTAAVAGDYMVGYVGTQPNLGPLISPEIMPSQQIFVDSYAAQQSKCLGYALIAIGVVSVIWQTVSIALMNWGLISVGHGFWCGIVFMITGCVGVWAAGKVRRIVAAFYLLCILSVVLSICLFGLSVATADAMTGYSFYYWGNPNVIKVMQSLLATTAVAAGVVSVRGIFICRCVVQLCSSYTSAFGVQGAWHPSGLQSIDQQLLQQQMLQRQSPFLQQQLQLSPQTAAAHSPVIVFMMPSQAQSPFGTPMFCQMPVQTSPQQTLYPPTLQSLQTAVPYSNHGVVYMMIPAAAAGAATSSVGGPGSLVAAQLNATAAPPPYPTAC